MKKNSSAERMLCELGKDFNFLVFNTKQNEVWIHSFVKQNYAELKEKLYYRDTFVTVKEYWRI